MRILGLDGGIASIGWALIDKGEGWGEIVACGVRMFDAPETDKERTPTNQVRRLHRSQRRVIRRRRQRMAALRALFARHGLLPQSARDALHRPELDPWELRAAALDRRLSELELAVALGNIARHRGFRSNAKRDSGANAPDESKKMLKAMEASRERLGAWRTVGEMFARDPAFEGRKRNRNGEFTRTVLRADLERETRAIFAAQRRLGNDRASEELEEAFAKLAFTQRPLQDSEHLVGPCPFEPGEKRTARRACSFELFRLLSRLANLKLISGGGEEQRLDPDQIARVSADFGAQKRITYKSLRKLLDLDPRARFDGVPLEREGDDIVARTGAAAEGTATLRNVLGSAWESLLRRPGTLDRIAEVITFRDDVGRIRAGLEELPLEPPILDALMAAVAAGTFGAFTGAGHISAKAARAVLPHLARGLVYSDACAEAGYDHAARAVVDVKDIRNPVARKALGEMLKQVRAIEQAFGKPDLIHVELARELGKGAEERDKLRRGIERRTAEKEQRRKEFGDLLGLKRLATDEELLRYELWREQNGRCLYTDEAIPADALIARDARVQVDHILPWSRFGDDSFLNKTLCFVSANQQKKGRTPFEWFSAEKTPSEWNAFVARVEMCKAMKGQKKGGFYLRRNAAEVEDRFRNRNLGDTRLATRVLLDLLGRQYGKEGERRVRARPGPLTAKLRRAWGLETIKKNKSGERREDDRHHALDALIVAATDEAALQALTRAFQEAERRGLTRELTHGIAEPWPGFADAARKAVAGVFVSRAERRRARGEAHAATIRQVRERDGRMIVYERKAVEALKPADLERLKDRERNGALKAALEAWLAAGRPKEAPPRSPKGDVIRKVRLETDGKVAVEVREGSADRGEMVRVDVFREPGSGKRKDRFHLVPIYPHQIADRASWPKPPDRAVVHGRPEHEWQSISGFQFLFSAFPNTLLEVTKPDGEVLVGYFKGLDRSDGTITLAAPSSSRNLIRSIGTKKLLDFRKFAIDRLGRISAVGPEKRTWHGAVCM